MAALVDTKNELLAQAADRAVLAGTLRPEAAADVADIYGSKCVVTADGVLLNNEPLDVALAKLIEARPHWKPVTAPDPKLEALDTLRAQALAGNATALGKLYRADPTAYAAFVAKTGAAPGKVVAADGANGANDPHKTNPFSKAGWNLKRQGELVRAMGLDKVNAEIAGLVGVKVGATRAVM
jgi:hypothetical protein